VAVLYTKRMQPITGTITLEAQAHEVFEAWLSSEIHTEMTGGTAQIDPTVGGSFAVWDGYASGTTATIDKNALTIVQSWRENSDDWPKEHFSTLKVWMVPTSNRACELHFEHSDVPEDRVADIAQGWQDFYWQPMQAYFAST
jgi:activator of HSP90 ATPase